MENKKSFILYCDLIHLVRKMKKDDAGELLLHILEYVNDTNPVTGNIIVDLTFEPIKQQLKRDLIQWEETRGERVISGHLGGIKSGESRRLKKQNKGNEGNALKTKQNEANEGNALKTKQTKETEGKGRKPKENEANEAVTVTVNVTDTVTKDFNNNKTPKVNLIENKIEKNEQSNGNFNRGEDLYTRRYGNSFPELKYRKSDDIESKTNR